MDELEFELFKLRNAGYCCTQMMMKLALDAEGTENPDLMKAMQGLCMGVGGLQKTCGVLTGGLAIIGLYAGKGKDDEQPHPDYFNMVDEYIGWFESEFGSTDCEDIIGACTMAEYKSNQDLLLKCGDTLKKCYEMIQQLLSDYNIEFGNREEA